MKTLFSIFSAVLFFVISSSYAASTVYAPVSPLRASDLDLNQFPVEKGPLSAKRQAELGLRPYVLTNEALFFNHQSGGLFSLKLMKAGTVVLVDKEGTPRYEEKCGNRLIGPREIKTPAPKSEIGDAFPAPKPIVVEARPAEPSVASTIRGVFKGLPEPAKSAIEAIGFLGLLGMVASVAILIGAGLLSLWAAMRRHRAANP